LFWHLLFIISTCCPISGSGSLLVLKKWGKTSAPCLCILWSYQGLKNSSPKFLLTDLISHCNRLSHSVGRMHKSVIQEFWILNPDKSNQTHQIVFGSDDQKWEVWISSR
jgi:hypothetical protein